MIPKTIHLCWFSGDPYPVEIKMCLDSWHRTVPDFRVRVWTYEDAKAIGCDFIDEALEARRWAFAADAVRFYAVYKEGGVYMDSDIRLMRRFDELMEAGPFVTFNERDDLRKKRFGLQAAFFMGEAGNTFCRLMFEHYASRHYLGADGTADETISPYVMLEVAESLGYRSDDGRQTLPAMTVLPTHYVAPNNHYPVDAQTIARHCIYGSWRKRSFGRRIELWWKHVRTVIRYTLSRH